MEQIQLGNRSDENKLATENKRPDPTYQYHLISNDIITDSSAVSEISRQKITLKIYPLDIN